MKRVVCAICLLLIVSITCMGCAGVELVPRIPFPVEEYQKLPKMGTGTAIVQGQAFLKTRGGDVKYAAGIEIYLFPVTSYSDQWYHVYLEGKLIDPTYDPRYRKYVTTTMGDGEGRFEFKNVPAGDYYLNATILWEVPRRGGYLWPTGGIVIKRISVEDGQELRVILTR